MANVDLSKLSDEQLKAIASGNLDQLPDDVLRSLAGFDQPATPEVSAQLPSYREAVAGPEAFVSDAAGIAAPPEMAKESGVAGVRYGLPLAVGIATGGMGYAPAAAISSAVSAGGEAAAQFLEKKTPSEEMRYREIGAAGVGGLAAPIRAISSPILNFLANAGVSVGATQASKAVRRGKIELMPEDKLSAVTEYGLPVSFAGLGAYAASKAQTAKKAAERVATLAEERGGFNILPGEVVEGYQGMEARMMGRKSSKIASELLDLDANIADRFNDFVKDAPRQEELARKLIPYQQNLGELQAKAQAARNAANDAEQAAKIASLEGSESISELEAAARGAAVKANQEYQLYTKGIERAFGTSLGDVGTYATGARIDRIKKSAETANNAIKQNLDVLYKQTGLKPDTGVVRLDDIRAELAKNIPGTADWVELVEQVEKAAKKPGMMLGGDVLTLNAYQRIRDDIATGLKQQGEQPSSASRKASQAYDAIRTASYNFLGETNPNALKALEPANKAAAAVFKAKGSETGVIADLAEGKIDAVVDAIEKQGYGPIVREIQGYAKAIAGTGGREAVDSANSFLKDSQLAIRDYLIETSLNLGKGEDNASKAIDMAKFIGRLDSLRQKGLKPEMLGIAPQEGKGKASQYIKGLAKIASYEGGSITVERFNEFIDDVAKVGGDKALVMQKLQQIQKGVLLDANTASKEAKRAYFNQQLAKAKLTADEAETVLARAKADPVVEMLYQPGFALNPKGDNTKYVVNVLNGGPEGARNLMKALRTPIPGNPAETASRAKLADDIGKTAVSTLLFDNVKKAMLPGDQRLILSNISEFFEGTSSASTTQREAMKELIGQEAFANLKRLIGDPVINIHKTYKRLAGTAIDVKELMTTALGAKAQIAGQGTGRGVIAGSFGANLINQIDNFRHNVGYVLYIRPDTAKAFRQAAYNVDNFINSSPRNALIYRLAVQDDQQAAEAKP